MSGDTDGPVFVCGAERSGTSLMYALLSSHSRLSTAPMGRYRTALRPTEISFIQMAAGREMRRLGYTLDPVDLRGSARWRFAAVTVPRDMCRLNAWSIRQRREQTRERPPAARLEAG